MAHAPRRRAAAKRRRSEGTRHVVVVGIDDEHREQLEALPGDLAFHGLYRFEELKRRDRIPMEMLLEDGPRRLREAPHPVDAVVGYWDFPVSTVLPVLQRSVGVRGPTIESVLACEHKYWSRMRQREVLPDLVPAFCAVDPFADDPMEQVSIRFPFWLKPVKSLRSHLAFRVCDEAEFDGAIARIRDGIRRFGDPFDLVLERAEQPADVDQVTGNQCIAEGVISATRQCTVEGYELDGETTVYGIVDSHREGPAESCFGRYQYPSAVPEPVADRMRAHTIDLVRHLGYRDGPFNVEFFWDEETDRLWVLEANPRISKSHAPLFQMVDGRSNFEVMVAVALGERPDMPHREGRHRMAAKFMYRRYENGVVTRAPTADELAGIERGLAVRIHLEVEEGMRLDQLYDQDPYSFEVGQIFVGGDSTGELLDTYRSCIDRLGLEIDGAFTHA